MKHLSATAALRPSKCTVESAYVQRLAAGEDFLMSRSDKDQNILVGESSSLRPGSIEELFIRHARVEAITAKRRDHFVLYPNRSQRTKSAPITMECIYQVQFSDSKRRDGFSVNLSMDLTMYHEPNRLRPAQPRPSSTAEAGGADSLPVTVPDPLRGRLLLLLT